jgi:hypothetical protein
VKLGSARQLAEKLAKRGHGTTMGDWVAIFTEVRESREFGAVATEHPFFELIKTVPIDSATDRALRDFEATARRFRSPACALPHRVPTSRTRRRSFGYLASIVSCSPVSSTPETHSSSSSAANVNDRPFTQGHQPKIATIPISGSAWRTSKRPDIRRTPWRSQAHARYTKGSLSYGRGLHPYSRQREP